MRRTARTGEAPGTRAKSGVQDAADRGAVGLPGNFAAQPHSRYEKCPFCFLFFVPKETLQSGVACENVYGGVLCALCLHRRCLLSVL